jgi:hypothetical protein
MQRAQQIWDTTIYETITNKNTRLIICQIIKKKRRGFQVEFYNENVCLFTF